MRQTDGGNVSQHIFRLATQTFYIVGNMDKSNNLILGDPRD